MRALDPAVVGEHRNLITGSKIGFKPRATQFRLLPHTAESAVGTSLPTVSIVRVTVSVTRTHSHKHTA